MAKRLGVRVIRFSIGYPPKIWGVRRGETEYSIGLTPFGGYVRMLGEEVGEEPRSDELQNYVHELALDVLEAAENYGWSLPSKDPDQKILALANALGLRVRTHDVRVEVRRSATLKPEEADVMREINARDSVADAQTYLGEHPTPALLQVIREALVPHPEPVEALRDRAGGSALEHHLRAHPDDDRFPVGRADAAAGRRPGERRIAGLSRRDLLPGDRIVSVNGKPVESWNDFSAAVKSGNGTPLKLGIERGTGSSTLRQELTITPKREDEPTVYGTKVPTWIIGVMPRGDELIKRYGPIDAVEHGVSPNCRYGGDPRDRHLADCQWIDAGASGARWSHHDRADGGQGSA